MKRWIIPLMLACAAPAFGTDTLSPACERAFVAVVAAFNRAAHATTCPEALVAWSDLEASNAVAIRQCPSEVAQHARELSRTATQMRTLILKYINEPQCGVIYQAASASMRAAMLDLFGGE